MVQLVIFWGLWAVEGYHVDWEFSNQLSITIDLSNEIDSTSLIYLIYLIDVLSMDTLVILPWTRARQLRIHHCSRLGIYTREFTLSNDIETEIFC